MLDRALERVAKGHTESLETIYTQTSSAVYAYILSIVKNADDAEDILQDTYIKVCLNASQYSSQGKPMAWILTIARNLSLMKLRSGKRVAELEDYEWESIVDESADFKTEDRMVLNAALSGVSDEESQIVMLHAVAGLKHREIADMLNLPLATVLSKYNRALKKMRHIIEG